MSSLHKDITPLGSNKAVRGLGILLLILFIGTLGFMYIEKWDFLDSLYMTVITITTVGFKEVREISDGGRIFTIFIILFGMGIIAYILGTVAQMMVDVQVRSIIGRTKLGFKMKSIKNHYIVCGFGRIGKVIGRELQENKIPMVIIDSSPEARQSLEGTEIPMINDDAIMSFLHFIRVI